ncbi:MAG TPA: hypothetical protein VHX16_01740, partial [Chloroflexota bacterium]|nr:hypothetical protein [Chloroflexota bacterium]
VELVGPDDRVVARGEANPYGADLWSPTEIITSIHELAIEQNVAPGPYTLALSFGGSTPRPNLADPRALLYRAPLATVTVEPPSQTLQPAQLGVPIRSPWTVGSLQILGATVARATLHPGDPLELSLAWQSVQASPQPVHLSGELVGAIRTTLIPSLVPLDGSWPLERWRRAEATVDRRMIVIPNNIPPGNYQLQVRDNDRAEASYDVGVVTIEAAQRRMEPLAVRAPSEATLGSSFRLVGYDLRNRRPDAGESVDLGLTWQALTAPPTRYVVVISLIDAETNRVVARQETEPSDGSRPTTGWSNGEYVVDNHRVRTSRDLPRGRYRVRVDMVERDTGRYLLDANGIAGILLPPEVTVE